MPSIGQVRRSLAKALSDAGVDCAPFAADQLIMFACSMTREKMLFSANEEITQVGMQRINDYKTQLLNGCPLQYIIGKWEFYSLPLLVGDGVLIPRADTEVLVETVADRLRDIDGAKILDLCAGSGCVGIAVASECKNACVMAVEFDNNAFEWLQKNIDKFDFNIQAVKADVLKQPDERFSGISFDCIVSNPPYIRTEEIKNLDKQVADYEPLAALDGGKDGLTFYRSILSNWSPLLKSGGTLAVEIGFDQGKEVAALFRGAGLDNVRIIKDYSNNDRVVMGIKTLLK